MINAARLFGLVRHFYFKCDKNGTDTIIVAANCKKHLDFSFQISYNEVTPNFKIVLLYWGGINEKEKNSDNFISRYFSIFVCRLLRYRTAGFGYVIE